MNDGGESSKLDKDAVRMVEGRKHSIVKQNKTGSDSLGTRSESHTATTSSLVLAVVFSGVPGFQPNGVDAGFIFDGEDAGAFWSLS